MKHGVAIRETHAAEAELASELTRLGERHKADHDVYHLTRTLADAAGGRMRALEPHAERYGESLDGDAAPAGGGVAATLREKGAELAGRRSETGLLLLRDLRALHLLAAEASIDWTILGQGAQAARDAELLETVTRSHPDALRTLRWTTTKLKEQAPQVLTS
ncbi:MAG TPA: hypothetical protein VF712_01600 [Thermoleophilaceae bacterium]|jgi:hypothetical protein